MPTYLAIVWVLFLLAANGHCLVCEVCINLAGNSCSGDHEPCNSLETSCIATLTETTLGSETAVVHTKGCGNECHLPVSMTAGNFHVKTISRCCHSDHCNSGLIDWTPTNTTANGNTCPSCLAENSQYCNKSETISCTGSENQCIKFTATKHRASQITFIGCATESMSESRGKLAFPETTVTVTDFSYMSNIKDGHNGGVSLILPHPGLSLLISLLLFELFSASPF
ncbi:phospholipase A2 inhibitor and Ly6/PLAUR domain-containing protein-like [Ambystoma mexicanum]|uniref:phospholipase A2 inhibitor and Ly6/PLAUR domain-containing protein-like n=1 Tax=Ambystoma mexicanum TaxID=8296 RepID=UPI0037E82025